jgi:hypothetical protein
LTTTLKHDILIVVKGPGNSTDEPVTPGERAKALWWSFHQNKQRGDIAMSKMFTRTVTTGTTAHFIEWDMSGTVPTIIQEDVFIIDKALKDKAKAARIIKRELALEGMVVVQDLQPKTKTYTCSLEDFMEIATEIEE